MIRHCNDELIGANGGSRRVNARTVAPPPIGIFDILNRYTQAAAVAEVTTANGVTTFLCDKAAPTPVVSYNLVTLNAGGGIVITASHNPARWNGFKYKPDYGGSASPEVVEELEAFIAEAGAMGNPMRMTLAEAESKGVLEYIDPEPAYLSHIANLVDVGHIRRAG